MLQSAGAAAYRLAARGSGQILASVSGVSSVYAHRSVATGEVRFARSDTDLLLFLDDADPHSQGETLLRLSRRARLAKVCNPPLGEIEIHDHDGWRTWLEADTYRGSQDVRSALRLAGATISMPPVTVEKSHAVRRFVLFFHAFVTRMWRKQDERGMKKIALEMWNAYAVATGLISEPCLTRAEMERHCRKHQPDAVVDELGRRRGRALALMLRLAEQLEADTLEPLLAIPEIRKVQAALGASLTKRPFVILPGPDTAPPPLSPSDRLTTPSLLNLLFHFAFPFSYALIPDSIKQLGLAPASAQEQVSAIRHLGHSQRLRYPGLMNNSTDGPQKWCALAEQVAEAVRVGAVVEQPRTTSFPRPTLREYYRDFFPDLAERHARVWEQLSPPG